MHFFLQPFCEIPYYLSKRTGYSETYTESCSYKLKLFILFSLSIVWFKTTDYICLHVSCKMLIWSSILIRNNSKSIEHVVNFLKLALRVLKTVLKDKKKLIFKNRLKHLKRKCFSVLGQKQSRSHEVRNGWRNLQRFNYKPLKPFCLSSEQGFTSSHKKIFYKVAALNQC